MNLPPRIARQAFCLYPCWLVLGWGVTMPAAAEPDYTLVDPELKIVRLDTDPTESFLSVRTDAKGRLYVGGREALFVYEPEEGGLYSRRRELFRFPNHSWVYDIEIRGEDVYALTNTALYLLRGGVVKRQDIEIQRLVWGMPMGHVHQCMHGLAWGPDGDLYFSTGDPLPSYGDIDRPDRWHYWTFFSQPGRTPTPFHGQGGVYRCRPDGTRFQIFARGTRNSIGLAFDGDWNLFTNDNDHESMPVVYVPGRLLHVTQEAQFNWPRAWLLAKHPMRSDVLETMNDNMGRAVPVGVTYYDDAFLPPKYRRNLFVARWGTRSITRFPLERRGASYRAAELPLLEGKNLARPLGVCVGRGGRLFATICYMAHNEGSPTYRSDLIMITRQEDPPTAPYDGYEAHAAEPQRLWRELASESWSRRYHAFVELGRRGEAVLVEAINRLREVAPTDPSATPLIWLAAASGDDRAGKLLREMAQRPSETLRLQAIRALAEFPRLGSPASVFERALGDPVAAVRHAATTAFFKRDEPLPETIALTSGRSDDSYLRQAATLVVARRGTLKHIESLCRSDDARTRLAGVLAAGFRLTTPAAVPLDDELSLAPYRNEAAYLVEYADEKIDLRQFGRMGSYSFAEHWNARPHSADEDTLFSLLMARLDDDDERVRLQAAHFLGLLNDPRSRDAIAATRRASEERRVEAAPIHGLNEMWAVGPFADAGRKFEIEHPPQRAAIDPDAEYKARGEDLTWTKLKRRSLFDLVGDSKSSGDASYYAYVRFESAVRQRIMLMLGTDGGVRVWLGGRAVWSQDEERGALPFQDNFIVQLEPGSNDLLVRLRSARGACRLYLHYRAVGAVATTLPEKLGADGLASRLKEASRDVEIDPAFLTLDWPQQASAGDAKKGRELFESIGCGKCHSVGEQSTSVGGPSLATAGKRFTVPTLVESILFPSRQVSPVFHGVVIVDQSGRVFNGLVLNETSDVVELLLPDAKRRRVNKREIAQRDRFEGSVMPTGLVRKPKELADLLAYLMSL